MHRRRWRKSRSHDVAELNITAFMNLMVILVPFLLITAVFSRVAVLELSLPAPSDQSTPLEEPEFQLEVVVREDVVEIGDTQTGILKSISRADQDIEATLAELGEFLQQVKAQYPDKTAATILLEQDIAYETLVQVMDTVRVILPSEERPEMGELFPDISVGDAVQREQSAEVAEVR